MPTAADAIHFVLTEAARFQKAFAEGRFDVIDNDKMDGFWTIPAADGRGALICGQVAGQQLFDTLADQIKSGPYHGRIDLKRLYEAYKREIMARFITQRLDLSDENATAAFEAALAPSLERLSNFTHVMPCHLVMAKDPDHLVLGPVTFWRREAAWPRIADALSAFDVKQSSDPTRCSHGTTSYYASFDWLVEVHVEACEEEPSYELAERMAWSAIDCLQLQIRDGRLERMALGGRAFESDRRAHIIMRNGNIASLRTSSIVRDVTLTDEVWRQTELPAIRHSLDLMGVALTEAYRLPKPAALAERFIDAVHWFGLAMRDTNPSSRFIMLLLAVERLLVPRKPAGIESAVRFRSEPFMDWDKHNRRIKDLYEVRGQLVHGQLSTRAPAVLRECRNARTLAESVLFEVLHFFGREALHAENVTVDMIEAAFENYAKACVERRKQRAATMATDGDR